MRILEWSNEMQMYRVKFQFHRQSLVELGEAVVHTELRHAGLEGKKRLQERSGPTPVEDRRQEAQHR